MVPWLHHEEVSFGSISTACRYFVFFFNPKTADHRFLAENVFVTNTCADHLLTHHIWRERPHSIYSKTRVARSGAGLWKGSCWIELKWASVKFFGGEILCPNDPHAFFRDAEKILREKELGCFLIRLSNKSIGYILSYKWVVVLSQFWACLSMDLSWEMISDCQCTSTSCVSLLQRQRSLSTLCDQPKQIRAVFVLWGQEGSRHGAWSHWILQDGRHSAIWGTAYDLVFWGKTKIYIYIFFLLSDTGEERGFNWCFALAGTEWRAVWCHPGWSWRKAC